MCSRNSFRCNWISGVRHSMRYIASWYPSCVAAMESPPQTATLEPPTEIWRLIFRFATGSDTSYHVDYLPFQPIQELQETAAALAHEDVRLQTCLSLMRVSRRFRTVAAEFMYEDVRIHDAEGLASIMAGLTRSARDDGANSYGRYVRRLELPRRRTKFAAESHSLRFPIHPIPCEPTTSTLIQILRLCSRLEILVRPCLRLDAQNITFWASLIRTAVDKPLAHLMRLEWHESELDARFYGTNHTDRLREIVAQSPNLRYLFLSSDRQNSLVDLSLPRSLHTLRLNRSLFHSQSGKKYPTKSQHTCVPNIRNLVLHSTLPSTLLDFIARSGEHLRVLELAFAPQMVFSSNQMQRLLTRCPKLEELAMFIGAPEISPLTTSQCPSIKRVRLKIDPDEWHPYKPVLRGQTEVLEGRSFPELQEIILHDPTRWFMRRESGKELVRRMLRRGCTVNYEDGSPVVLPT
ncbi:hypothetical protein DFH09DRAFT_1368110 [Mycena vulgaris]|nr:hypothetical protein DFH09DRAFT_1368110 [Mycena vulgaris]